VWNANAQLASVVCAKPAGVDFSCIILLLLLLLLLALLAAAGGCYSCIISLLLLLLLLAFSSSSSAAACGTNRHSLARCLYCRGDWLCLCIMFGVFVPGLSRDTLLHHHMVPQHIVDMTQRVWLGALLQRRHTHRSSQILWAVTCISCWLLHACCVLLWCVSTHAIHMLHV
jgi:hypothetical protein